MRVFLRCPGNGRSQFRYHFSSWSPQKGWMNYPDSVWAGIVLIPSCQCKNAFMTPITCPGMRHSLGNGCSKTVVQQKRVCQKSSALADCPFVENFPTSFLENVSHATTDMQTGTPHLTFREERFHGQRVDFRK